MVEERYDVYHLVIKEGHNYKISPDSVDKCWKNILGQRVIPVEDYTKIPEIITSILELRSGKNKKEIINSWDGSTSLVVKSGLASLTESIKGKTKEVWRPKTLVNN